MCRRRISAAWANVRNTLIRDSLGVLYRMDLPYYIGPWSETSRTTKEALGGCRDAGHESQWSNHRGRLRHCKVEEVERQDRLWQKPGLIPGRK